MQHVVENALCLKRPEIDKHEMDESQENETDCSSYKELYDSDDESDDGSVTKNNVE